MASTMSRVKSRGWLVVKRTRRMPRHLADSSEQLGEAQLPFRIAIAVDVLAEELDLGVALVGDAPRFCKHR